MTTNNTVEKVQSSHLRKGRGFAEIGREVSFLDPGSYDLEVFEEMQQKNIKDHGGGPFTVIDMEKRGSYFFICFIGKNGKKVWLHSDCFTEAKQ